MKQVAALFFCTALLCACSPSVETRVNSLGGMAGNPLRSYRLASLEGAPADLDLARRLVGEKLASQGFAASPSPDLFLEVTVAARPASLALASAGKQGDTILAPAAPKKGSAKCANLDVRLGVTITRLSDGKQAYRATASEVHCNPVMSVVLPVLVDAALADLSKAVAGAGGERTYKLKHKLR